MITVRPATRRLTAAFLAAAAAAAALAATITPASATTAACGNMPRCFGLLSAQAKPLEIDVNVPSAQAKAGTPLIGVTPANAARGDWYVGIAGTARKFRFAPNGVTTSLCITASSDVVNSRPTLQTCVSGTAGSSHQLWIPRNVIGGGFRVFQNAADGLVLALETDTSGTVLRLRPMLAGTGTNKNLVLFKPF